MSSATVPSSSPVTGDEYSGDQRQPQQALAQFYRALNSRDMSLMQENWDNSPEAAMDNPLGGIRRGWDQISAVYDKLFRSSGTYRFEFHDYTMHPTPDIFYVVGRERGTLTINGLTLDLAIRTSRIFRRAADGRWRQVHHHGSIDDPRMLAEYQRAVLDVAA